MTCNLLILSPPRLLTHTIKFQGCLVNGLSFSWMEAAKDHLLDMFVRTTELSNHSYVIPSSQHDFIR